MITVSLLSIIVGQYQSGLPCLTSKAGPVRRGSAGIRPKGAPDAPVNTNPAATERAMEERDSPKMGVLSACCIVILLRMRLIQTEERLRRPIMMLRLPSKD